MAYNTGGLIEASDFNDLRNQLEQVYGVGFGNSGYGQTAINLPVVAGGLVELVKSVEWANLRSAAIVCGNHQGTSVDLPAAGQLAQGALIRAHTASDNDGDIPTTISDLSANRLNIGSGTTSVFMNQITSTRTTSWSTQIRHEIDVTFPTVDDARYFFNSGGEIRFRASRSGGSGTAQNSAWTSLLNTMGTLRFNHNDLIVNSGVSSNLGYYELPVGGFGLLYDLDDTATNYTSNNVQIFGQTIDGPGGGNGDNGRRLRFRINYNDGSGGFTDSVNGTFVSAVDMRQATTHLTVNAPSFSNVTVLTAGS